ncbi:hypothetical protein JCM8097_002058, partial [Rhodosporidiobolus ruineniae]
LKELNEPPMKGHSIRIGGATQLLLNGIDPKIVMKAGGWSSEVSFLAYWRHAIVLIETGKVSSFVEAPTESAFQREVVERREFLFEV